MPPEEQTCAVATHGALSESKRTESNWIMTKVFDAETDQLVAEVILNSATLKESYEKYEEDAKALGREL